jgi:hypothetical protein
VDCNYEWHGSYGDLRGQRTVDGVGDEEFILRREGQDPWIISAVFQKGDLGSYLMEVCFETEDGERLDSEYTSAEFGVVTVTWCSED